MTHVAVVGGGQAGFSVVAKLRSLGFAGRISLICEEPELPYQRPPLSKKYLTGALSRERLSLRPAPFYDDNCIDVEIGQACCSIDARAQMLAVGDRELHYDELVLATGSVPRSLPASIGGNLQGVHTVRTVADIDAMSSEMVEGGELIVIGGGYIGLEVASAATACRMKVTVVEIADRILKRVAATETSEAIRSLHQSHGVNVLEGVGLERLQGHGRVTGARLTDGTVLSADVVIAGVGITPATALAEAAGVEIDNGIRTDLWGRTSIPSIWAAGDCASFPWKDGRIRLESVQNAIDQAELVAENIAGAEKEYRPTPWFWSDQYDAKLQIAGLGNGYDRIVERRPIDSDSVSFWYFRKDSLLAVDAINDSRSYMLGKRLLETGKPANPDAVADTSVNLMTLLRSK